MTQRSSKSAVQNTLPISKESVKSAKEKQGDGGFAEIPEIEGSESRGNWDRNMIMCALVHYTVLRDTRSRLG